MTMCNICTHILDYDAAQHCFVHGSAAPKGHDPVPIPYVAENATIVCDLCSYQQVPLADVWTIPCRSFEMPTLPDMQPRISDGDWAACSACAALIRAGKWSELATAAIGRHATRAYAPVMRAWVAELHARLRNNMTGPPRPGAE